jgi:DNA-binding transcriptional MerR regulator
MSSERPYLSIGEVLELLKHEFPDLSISRIRGFESTGQLELERTASGYRKFYDQDIVFLRSLLGASILTGAPSDESIRVIEQRRVTVDSSVDSSVDSNVDSNDESFDHDAQPVEFGPNGELPGEPERRHPAAFQSLRRELASKGLGAGEIRVPDARGPEAPSRELRMEGIPTLEIHADEVPTEVRTHEVQTEVPPPEVHTVADPHLTLVATMTLPSSSATVDLPHDHANISDANTSDANTSDANTDATVTHNSTRNLLAANPSGLNLSLQELADSAGVTLETVRELEGLGLVRGQGVFSTVYYDEDALLTCKLVASFQTYGVEPRHLRMYKLAADREASFFEQVVTPQLRRRNPDARAQAIETLGELVRLGEQLRVVALRQVLRAAVDR